MFARKGPVIAESMALCSQQYATLLHNIFRPLQAKLEASKRFDDTKLDILAGKGAQQEIGQLKNEHTAY